MKIEECDFIIYLVLCSFIVLILTNYFYNEGYFAFEDPNNFTNIFAFIFPILIGTIIFLILIKFLKHKIKKNILLIDIFLIFSVFFSIFNFNLFNFLMFLILVLFRIKLKNIACLILNLFILPTVGIIFGISISPIILIIITYLLAIYDFVSVFLSKHMVKMAKAISETDSLLLLKFKNRKIGAGDYVISLMIQSNFLLYFGFKTYLFCLVSQIISFFVMKYVIEKYNISLPALIFIVPFSHLALILSFIL